MILGAAPARNPLAAAVVAALECDPGALAELRELLTASEPVEPQGPPAYTVGSLAAALAISAKVVRNAIGRGELAAVKRAGRWLIPADAVEAWTHPAASTRRLARTSSRNSNGPLTEAFQRFDRRARRA